LTIFEHDGDFAAFEAILAEAVERAAKRPTAATGFLGDRFQSVSA
jgi:hypothetical protein